jgi:hypothetical protein
MSKSDLLRILAAKLRYALKWVPSGEVDSFLSVLSMYESSVIGPREADARVCANCRYGSPFSHTPRYLRCRLNPPVVIMNPGGSLDSAWPTVERDDWCSRWMSSDSSPD